MFQWYDLIHIYVDKGRSILLFFYWANRRTQNNAQEEKKMTLSTNKQALTQLAKEYDKVPLKDKRRDQSEVFVRLSSKSKETCV